MSAGYTINTDGGAIALTAATAKSILSYYGLGRLTEWHVGFDGVTATAVPVLVEVCSVTNATAGTKTAGTARQVRGTTRSIVGSVNYNYTAEPTTITVLKTYLIPAFMGSFTMQHPLGREVEQVTSTSGIILRVTAPAAVNVRGYMEIEEG